jgi:hypothetical protein
MGRKLPFRCSVRLHSRVFRPFSDSLKRLSDKSLDGPQRFMLVALKVAKMVLVGEF